MKKLFLTFFLLISTTLSYAESSRVLIPGGISSHGCSVGDPECESDEGPVGGVAVNVPAFMIDRQEVSVAEYRACVEAGECSRPFDYLRTHYCHYGAPGRDDYPVNCVNWHQALNYCQWQGGRLAYAVEWEKAARGGTSTAHFWGNEPASCKVAVMDPGKAGEPDTETDGCWRDLGWPRNSYPPNPLGLYDMIGGTSEWVMDWYDPDAHERFYAKGRLTGPVSGRKKVIKGGSWDEKAWAQRVTNRFYKPVTGNPDLYGSNGIRCVIPFENSLSRGD